MAYKLIKAFESLFVGVPYLHRNSTQGDYVASFLVDDLYALGRSPKLNAAVDTQDLVLNMANKTVGLQHRRGDGTFGIIVPGEPPTKSHAYTVSMGEVANSRHEYAIAKEALLRASDLEPEELAKVREKLGKKS